MIKPLSIPPKTLTQSINAASLVFKVSNIKSWALDSLGRNINLVAGDFGDRAFCCFRNDNGTIVELLEIDPTTIANTSITILRRGLNFNGDPDTQTTNYKLDWPAGTVIEFGTDIPQLLYQYPNIRTGAVAPASTPEKIGNIYVDTVALKVYIATGTSSSADYKILN